MKKILLTTIAFTLSLISVAQFCSGFLVNINVTSGTFPAEVSWELKNGSTILLSGGAPFTGQACIPNLCLNYTLVMNDSFGDGWNGATFTMSYGTWSQSTTLSSGSTGTTTLYAGVSGCTDPTACNYNSAATCNSGCIYGFAGCNDPAACNFEPLACFNNGTCCYNSCITLGMTDSFGDGWNGGTYTVTNSFGTSLYTGTLSGGSSGSAKFCLPEGCYTLQITGGSFPAEIGWTLGGGVAGIQLSGGAPITISFYTNNTPVGCTDELACNYDSSAQCDDGSCEYGFAGCMDTNACNYDPLACFNNGTCQYGNIITIEINDSGQPGYFEIYPHTVAQDYGPPNYMDEEIITVNYIASGQQIINVCIPDGCYDMWRSDNVDPDLTYSVYGFNSSYENLPPYVGLEGAEVGTIKEGCTHPDACNYNSNANCDDGTCTFEGVEHCMHLQVTNMDGTGIFTDEACMQSITFEIVDMQQNTVIEYAPDFYPQDDFYFTLPPGCYGVNVNAGPFCNFNFTLNGQNGPTFNGTQNTDGFTFEIGEAGCTDPAATNYNPLLCGSFTNCCYGNGAFIYLYDNPLDGWNGPFCNIYNDQNQLVYSHYMPLDEYDFLDEPCLPEGCYTYEIGTQFSLEFPENTLYIIGEDGDTQQGEIPATGSFIVGTKCSYEAACNYNPALNCEDFSECIYGFLGCTDPQSCDYEPLACEDDGSCYEHKEVSVEIAFYNWVSPADGPFYFSVYDLSSGTEVLVNTYEVPFTPSTESLSFNFCLADGCYHLSTVHEYEIAFVSISIQLGGYYSPVETYATYNFDNWYLNADFSVGNTQVGCMDPVASNYDPFATCNSYESCCYLEPSVVSITNFNAGTNAGFVLLAASEVYRTFETGSGSLLMNDCIHPGCYQVVSNAGAGLDFSYTLVTPSGVYSGTENSANQFIVVGESVGGCSDNTANNFNPFACFDDGSCCYDANIFIGLTRWNGIGNEAATLNIRNSESVIVGQVSIAGNESSTWQDGHDFICLPDGCYEYELIGDVFGFEILITIEEDHTLSEYLLNEAIFPDIIGSNNFEIVNGQFANGGCTDPQACNYSSSHFCDDGSCIPSGCTNPEACNYDSNAACDNGSCEVGNVINFSFFGLNIPEQATINTYDALGQILLSTHTVNSGNTTWQECLGVDGCYSFRVVPFPGSTYTFTVSGSLEGTISGNHLSGLTPFIMGAAVASCTDTNASNYYEFACSDNGFCCYHHNGFFTIYSNAFPFEDEEITIIVYDSEENIAFSSVSTVGTSVPVDYQGICLEEGCYFISSYSSNPFSDFRISLTDHDRNYPNATIDLLLFDYSIYANEFFQVGNPVLGCTNPLAPNYNPLALCDDGSCICENQHMVSGTSSNLTIAQNISIGKIIAMGDDYGQSGYSTFYNGEIITYYPLADIPIPVSLTTFGTGLCLEDGCYFASASYPSSGTFEFEITNLNDDIVVVGSNSEFVFFSVGDIVEGCADPAACNYNPLANCGDDSCCYGDDCLSLQFTDLSPAEFVTASLYTANGILVKSVLFSNAHSQDWFCAKQHGCFYIEFSPSGGSAFTWTLNGALGGSLSGNQLFPAIYFTMHTPVYGCTDPAASNFKSTACFDDGSCCYEKQVSVVFSAFNTPVYGTNYTGNLLVWNDQNLLMGTIPYDVTDNFTDDTQFSSICLPDGCYSVQWVGSNYSDLWFSITEYSTMPGSEYYTSHYQGQAMPVSFQSGNPVFGCLDSASCNYNPLATCSDGSCNSICPGDFDCNGVVNTSDLLIFMSGFGCTLACGPTDLNVDGVVNTTDLLLFMSAFGNLCN